MNETLAQAIWRILVIGGLCGTSLLLGVALWLLFTDSRIGPPSNNE